MKVNLGGTIPLSTVDWTGRACTVVFLRGCPLRCPFCHNFELQAGQSPVEFPALSRDLRHIIRGTGLNLQPGQITIEEAADQASAKPLVSALVLSGGEPLMQPEASRALLRLAKSLNLQTGVETCGYYPERLKELLDEGLLDKLFLDIKSTLREEDYARATGRKDVCLKVWESLEAALASGVSLEIRVTVFPASPAAAEVKEIATDLSSALQSHPGHGLQNLVLQQGRPREMEFRPVPLDDLKRMSELLADLVPVAVRGLPVTKWEK
ncbi:MAG: radical SAM protein [Methanotrichaceae archaeon]|nr:radical SAM protein [Methanotrichaceae archaeon]